MKELMPILALDPATQMGWALSPMISGVWDLSIKRDESMGMKFMRLRGKLNELLENYRIQLVVYEAARNASPKMQGSLVHQAQLQAIIIDWALLNGIESKGYSPKEIKKWATGNGNASKDAMVAYAKKRWPDVTIVDDNQADALLLWQMAMLEYKFLAEVKKGNIHPASALPALANAAPAPVLSVKTVPVPALPPRKLPGKILRAFKKAGRENAIEADKSLFLFRLNKAHIPFGKISSLRLAKVVKGEISLESLIEKRQEA
jgi:Holliday junction resolvasome RuvABC endonuclease subunit